MQRAAVLECEAGIGGRGVPIRHAVVPGADREGRGLGLADPRSARVHPGRVPRRVSQVVWVGRKSIGRFLHKQVREGIFGDLAKCLAGAGQCDGSRVVGLHGEQHQRATSDLIVIAAGDARRRREIGEIGIEQTAPRLSADNSFRSTR